MKTKRHHRRICFLLFLTAALLEYIFIETFLWAGFHGFGSGTIIVYTKRGRVATDMLILFPCLICLVFTVFSVIELYRQKSPAKRYFQFILTALCGIGTGILIFILDTYTMRIIWHFINIMIGVIEHSSWMEYVIP